jgi:hypothetical protein
MQVVKRSAEGSLQLSLKCLSIDDKPWETLAQNRREGRGNITYGARLADNLMIKEAQVKKCDKKEQKNYYFTQKH